MLKCWFTVLVQSYKSHLECTHRDSTLPCWSLPLCGSGYVIDIMYSSTCCSSLFPSTKERKGQRKEKPFYQNVSKLSLL